MTLTAERTLDTALDGAARAFARWRRMPGPARAAILDAVAVALEAAGGDLIPIADRETSLGTPRLRSELVRTVFQLRLLADEVRSGRHLTPVIDHADPEWPMGPRPDLRRTQRPLGPVLVFAASNFPFAFSVAGGDTAAALAAGCPVVLKAHSGHPELSIATAEVVLRALTEAGAPDGVFALIHGIDHGRAAIVDPRIKAAAFTGSTEAGRALWDLAHGRPDPIPFFGELGSVNPVFVTRAAMARRGGEVLSGFVGSFTLGSGQFCTKPGVLIVPAGAADVVADLVPGDPFPLLNDRIRSGFVAAVRDLAAETDALVTGSGSAPTLLRTTAAHVLADPDLIRREMFGPGALVVEYTDEQELLALAAGLEGQLTATVQAEPEDAVAPALLDLLAESSGRVLWNQWPTGVSVTAAQHHGGPWPATTTPATTSVGTAALARFLRPVAYQGVPAHLLPAELEG